MVFLLFLVFSCFRAGAYIGRTLCVHASLGAASPPRKARSRSTSFIIDREARTSLTSRPPSRQRIKEMPVEILASGGAFSESSLTLASCYLIARRVRQRIKKCPWEFSASVGVSFQREEGKRCVRTGLASESSLTLARYYLIARRVQQTDSAGSTTGVPAKRDGTTCASCERRSCCGPHRKASLRRRGFPAVYCFQKRRSEAGACPSIP